MKDQECAKNTLESEYPFIHYANDAEPETVANANLIAAAPDLLHACKIVAALHCIGDENSKQLLEQAIAKAEGRA